MAEILTTKLKSDTLRLFWDDIQNNEYYFTVSSISLDELTAVDVENSGFSKNQFKENILFGKRALQSDMKFMIKYHPWQKDAVYVQYDDKANLEDEKFYAVVGPTNNDSGDYRVYKCLSNNNGLPSDTPPNYNPTTENQIYRTPDGYVWKFMYYLTEQQFEAYNATGYIPIIAEFEINPEANTANVITGSEISDIFVENAIDNNGYPSIDNGIIANAPQNDSTMLLRNDFLSTTNGYYNGMTISIAITGTEETISYVIDTYVYQENTGFGKIKVIGDPQGDGILQNSGFKIVPTVKIMGDGTGGIGISRVVDGRITNIEVTNPGSGYNNIRAEVVDPLYDFEPSDQDSIDIRAQLRPILSPKGYHGYDLLDEMHCRHVLFYGYITEADNNKIGKSNSYSAVALMKNLTFTADPETANTDSPAVFDNRLEVITDDYGKVTINSLVKQIDLDGNKTFEGRVHEVQASSNTVFICSYNGPYVNQANNDVSLDYTKELINSTGQRLQINSPTANNVIESRYTQRSGTIYFMEDFVPLTRSETSREEYKLVLEF